MKSILIKDTTREEREEILKKSLDCGGSGIGKTAEKLAPSAPGAEIVDAKVLKSVGEI